MKNIIVLLTLVALAVVDCKKSTVENEFMVETKSGLFLRKEPDTKSKSLFLLPHGTKITVLEKTQKEENISNTRGVWFKIKHNGQDGWVFSGFLKQLPEGFVILPEPQKDCQSIANYAEKQLGVSGKEKVVSRTEPTEAEGGKDGEEEIHYPLYYNSKLETKVGYEYYHSILEIPNISYETAKKILNACIKNEMYDIKNANEDISKETFSIGTEYSTFYVSITKMENKFLIKEAGW